MSRRSLPRDLPPGYRLMHGIAVRAPVTQARLPELAADLFPQLRRLALAEGWHGMHTYNALGPDSGLQCILVREVVIFADVKDEGEPLTVQQREWQRALKAAGQEVYTWYPSLWNDIAERLSRRRS